MQTTIAVTGDSIINRRISVCEEPAVEEYLDWCAVFDVSDGVRDAA